VNKETEIERKPVHFITMVQYCKTPDEDWDGFSDETGYDGEILWVKCLVNQKPPPEYLLKDNGLPYTDEEWPPYDPDNKETWHSEWPGTELAIYVHDGEIVVEHKIDNMDSINAGKHLGCAVFPLRKNVGAA